MHRDNPYLTKKPDFVRLASRFPEFAQYVTVSEDGHASIDFQNASALRSLTTCLLQEDWDLDVKLREDRLCPTLPNRLDYLLHILDLEPYLAAASSSRPLRVLDIGTGATAIYPILLHRLRPTAKITATELDEVSYDHSLTVLSQNSVPDSSIDILRAPSSEPILFPILNDDTQEWDLTICNPPFFGSEEEMIEGQEGKEKGAHAAPTAANNELITPGGEVAFVGKMIKESLKIGERCRWYTSLIGKYSSLAPLVDRLRERKIDNYLLRSIKQSKTTRWILGWSHSPIRLPDSLARPEEVIPNTSFSRLLPQPNTFTHKPQPAIAIENLRQKVMEVLKDISLIPTAESLNSAPSNQDGENTVIIEPKVNTWSRSARRALARQVEQITDPSVSEPNERKEAESKPLFEARIRFIPPITAKDFSSISLNWVEGKDRISVEGLWKFILNKAELIGKKEVVDSGYGGRLGDASASGRWERGRGKGRGGGRGSGNGNYKSGVRESNGGRERNEEDNLTEGRRYGQRRRLI